MANKNVLAVLSGLVAVALIALAVFLHGQPLPVLGATAAAVGLCLWGVTTPGRRSALVVMVLAVGSGALFLHFDSFWGLFVAGLSFVWAAVGLLPVMDGAWRLKVGFVAAVFLGAVVALWPTIDGILPTANSSVTEGPLKPLALAARAIGSRLHCPG